MANTPNYNLYKPNRVDNLPVDTTLADNFTIIDTEIKNRKDDLDAHKASTTAHDSANIIHQSSNVKQAIIDVNTRVDYVGNEVIETEERLNDRIDNIIAQSGTSDTEVVDARGGFTVLDERLDGIDTKIEKTKLNWINVVSLGADNTGVLDASTIINNAISTYGANYTIYLPKGSYKLSNPILISSNNIDFRCDGSLLVNNISAIKLTSSLCNIYVSKITGSSNGTGFECGGAFLVNQNKISIGMIESCTNGFLLNPDTGVGGIQYNQFRFDYLWDCTNGINFKPGNISIPWINENQFYGGRIRGTTGIITRKGTNMIDRFNGNKFYNIGFENIVTPIDLSYAQFNTFENFRMSEAITGPSFFILDNSCDYNRFSSPTQISTTLISDAGMGNEYNFIITQTVSGAFIGKKLVTASGRKYIYPDPNMQTDANFNFYNQNLLTSSTPKRVVYFNGGVDSGAGMTASITLDNRYGFSGGNCNEFILELTFVGGGGATLKIIDSTGATIADQTTLTAGKYQFKWINTTVGWKWYKFV